MKTTSLVALVFVLVVAAPAGQYAEFLNPVAKDDPNELYNEFMAVNLPSSFAGANIPRSGWKLQLQRRSPPHWANRP